MYFKMQAACLLIVVYYIILYLRDTTGKNAMKCHPIFDLIMVISPWCIIFDAVSSWTVNHLDTVPYKVNLIFHILLYVSIEILVLLLFVYYTQVVFRKYHEPVKYVFFCIPGIISILATVVTSNKIRFQEGRISNYAAGIPVYVALFILTFYLLILSITMIRRYAYIEHSKRLNVGFYISFLLIITAHQIIFPQLMLTALIPTGCMIHIYENYEGASLRRLKRHNEEMATAFATLLDNRDNSTGGHIQRTKKYVELITNELQKYPKYKSIMTKDYMDHVIEAAPMHDIGKISVPDSILQKPGKLTDEEYEIMKGHSVQGGIILEQTFSDISDSEFLKIAYEVARFHHERWNGRGYPDGLSGEEIPLHARIMAIADVFDAVSSKRCYRDAMPLDECFAIIENGAGSDFDPQLVDIFMSIKDKITQQII